MRTLDLTLSVGKRLGVIVRHKHNYTCNNFSDGHEGFFDVSECPSMTVYQTLISQVGV